MTRALIFLALLALCGCSGLKPVQAAQRGDAARLDEAKWDESAFADDAATLVQEMP